MKKSTISIYNPFSPTQLTAIGEYLAEKESEGLKLTAYTKRKFTFQKAPEREVRYCVVIFRSVQRDEFLASAEEKGWEFVSSDREFYVFRTEISDAKPIKTERKDALKSTLSTLAGTGAFAILLLLHIFRLYVFRTDYAAPIETESSELTIRFLIFGFVILALMKGVHYLFWRIRAEKAVKAGRAIPFYNLKQTKHILLSEDVSGILLMLLWFASLCVFAFGYTSEVWHFYFEGGLAALYIIVVLTGRIIFKRKHTAVKIVALCILAALMAAGVYATAQLSLKEYESNSKYFLSYSGNPVSVTAFGITEENADEEKPIEKITPFAEYYIFRSRTHKETEDGRKPYIYYYILRSENENIVRKYEKQLIDNMQKYGSEIKEFQSDKWDYLCREVREGKEQDCGYAIKDNTIVYLDIISDISFEEFFDKAYENIF